MRLADMMTRDYATLRPGDTLKTAVRMLRGSQRDGLPVLRDDGTLAGIFTKTNLYDALLKASTLDEPVHSFYNRNVVKIAVDLTYSEVIDAVHRIPVGTGVVVERDGSVAGLFTKVELITSLFKEERMLNARLRAMYQAMHNGFISVDRSCRINLINRAAAQLFGLDEDKAAGRHLDELLPGLDMAALLEEGTIEIGAKYTHGGAIAAVNKTPLLDGGRVAGGLAIFQDVTELEQVAEELDSVKSLNRTLQTVLDIGYDAIVVVDGEGKVILANRSFLDFLRLEEKNVLRRTVDEVLENSRLHIIVKTGIPELNDIQFIEGKPYVVSRLPIVRDGEVIGAVGKISFRRVDELRELARRLEAMDHRLAHFQAELKKERHREQPYCFDDIITLSPLLERLKREARLAAQSTSTVLIYGESGVGKELFAQSIHYDGPRRGGPFIKINCAAIPENLLESELFGYAPGAFTGAQKQGKPGRIELADGGSLFLDEIGDLPLPLQAKLLRFLQDRTIERIGATAAKRVDLRVIAATNQDLEQKVEAGSFRKDLYFRLNVISLPVPPLRERPEDILPLVHAFLRKYNPVFGLELQDISGEALLILQDYDWPGNVRELENAVERAMNFTSARIIEAGDLPPHLRRRKAGVPGRPPPEGAAEGPAAGEAAGNARGIEESLCHYRSQQQALERATILRALQQSGGNKSGAARLLGMSRSWFYEKLARHKLLP